MEKNIVLEKSFAFVADRQAVPVFGKREEGVCFEQGNADGRNENRSTC